MNLFLSSYFLLVSTVAFNFAGESTSKYLYQRDFSHFLEKHVKLCNPQEMYYIFLYVFIEYKDLSLKCTYVATDFLLVR